MSNVFKWANGYPFKIPAEVAGEEISKIEKEYGAVTREKLVEVASDPKSPLHPAFEWNNDKAAHLYRLGQAKDMIAHLIITVEEPQKAENQEVRFFYNISEKPKAKGVYVNVETAFNDEEMKQTIFSHALAELQSFKAKYQNLKEFEKLFAEIDRLLAE